MVPELGDDSHGHVFWREIFIGFQLPPGIGLLGCKLQQFAFDVEGLGEGGVRGWLLIAIDDVADYVG